MKAGSNFVPLAADTGAPPRAQAGYLRDTRSGIIQSRPAGIRLHRDDVRRSWERAVALAADLVANSGLLKGAKDQIIADTIGVELICNPSPDIVDLGYTAEEITALIEVQKTIWQRYAWNPAECDHRGKLTVAQMTDIALTYFVVYGEWLTRHTYFDRGQRLRYRLDTGSKVLLIPPHRLVRTTIEAEGLYSGIWHDKNMRPVAYRFREYENGVFAADRDHPAFDADGRPLVTHAFDPQCAEDVRGMALIAPIIRKHLMAENADDAVAQMLFLQTVLAVVLTSEKPSAEAFEAMSQVTVGEGSDVHPLSEDFSQYYAAALDAAAEGKIVIGSDPQLSKLAPGEDIDFKSISAPGPDYLPLRKSFLREIARGLSVTFGALTLDNESATYSSVRMDNSVIWPNVMRRRTRIAEPLPQAAYEHLMEEKAANGELPIKGGYAQFRLHRQRFLQCNWYGPPPPSADDKKSAEGITERIVNGTSDIDYEISMTGRDPREVFERRKRQHKAYLDAGMPSPFERKTGSKAANDTSGNNAGQGQN